MTDQLALAQFRTAAATAQREEAFAQLVRTHAPWLYNAALRQVRDPAAAEEATQATFIVLAKKADGLRDNTSLTAWLARVLQLSVLRVKRDHARRTKYETQAAMNRTANPPAEDPADAAAWRELAPLLDEAVAKLTKTDREAILLRFYRQLSYAEMAGVLTIGEDAARKRVDRAVDRLRSMLSRHGLTGVAGMAALAALLWSHASAVAAPPGLVGTATTLAFATPSAAAAAPAVAVAKGVSAGMVMSKLKIAAAVLLLGVAGLAGEEAVRQWPGHSSTGGSSAATMQTQAPVAAPAEVHSPGVLVGRLKAGITVELIAVAASLDRDAPDGTPRAWWQPDGTPAADPPYIGRLVAAAAGAGSVPVEFFLRATGEGEHAPYFQASIDGGGSMAMSTSANPAQRPVVLSCAIASAVPDRPMTVRLGFALGEWRAESLTTPATAAAPDKPGSVSIAAPMPVKNSPDQSEFWVTRSGTSRWPSERFDSRLVVTDKSGQTYLGDPRESSGDANATTTVYRIKRRLNNTQIWHVQTELRSRDAWIEFRDVAIHAGQVTTPSVATSDDSAAPIQPAVDLGAMAGDWLAVKYQPGGQTVGPNMPADVRMNIVGDRMIVSGSGFSDTTTFTLDPSHTPKWIDFRRADGSTNEGIYEWQGETLRIRLGQRSRLKGFDAGPGTTPGVLMEFVRAKTGVPR